MSETTRPVAINGQCQPDTDPILIYPGDTVTWTFKKNAYDVDFETKFDPNPDDDLGGVPDNITPEPPKLAADKKSSTWTAPKDNPLDCSFDSAGKETGCYFKYDIFRIAANGDEIVCADPGVHVIPTGSLEPSNR